MLNAAILFFMMALVSMLFGAYGIAGVSLEVGKLLLGLFLVLSILSFLFSLITRKRI